MRILGEGFGKGGAAHSQNLSPLYHPRDFRPWGTLREHAARQEQELTLSGILLPECFALGSPRDSGGNCMALNKL